MRNIKQNLLVYFFLISVAQACKTSSSSSTVQNIEDAQSIQLRPGQGDYEVTCKDGTVEIVTQDQLRQGKVCVGMGDRAKVVCGQFKNGYVPMNADTGLPMGDPMDQSSCQLATKSTMFGAVCGLNQNMYGIYRISDQRWLGGLGSITACVAASSNAKRGTVCIGPTGQTKLTVIATGRPFGDELELQECQNMLQSVAYSAVCARFDGDFKVTRVTDGYPLGEATDFYTCNTAVASSSIALTCAGKSGGMVPVRYTDAFSLGEPMSANACNTIVSSYREGITCSLRDGGYFITRVDDGVRLGDRGDVWQGCLDSLKAANFKVVCTPQGEGMIPIRVYDKIRLGSAMQRQQCLDATSSILRDTICTYKNGQFYLTKISTAEQLGGPRTWHECINSQRNGIFPQ